MPSFTRRIASTSKPPPPGTHPSPSTPALHLLSTGLPSLDDLLGGGLPLGSTLLVLAPENHSAWSRLVERYWIAQGLVLGQKSCVVGDEAEGRGLVEGAMWVDEKLSRGGGGGVDVGGSESEGEGGEVGQGRGGTMIAWRYEKMKKYQTTVAGGSGSSSPLTLTTTIPQDILSHLHKTGQQSYIPLQSSSESLITSTILLNTLQRIKDLLDKADPNVALRLTIHELGSLDWGGEVTSQEIHRFLHCLRGMIRTKSVSAIITLPAVLAQSQPSSSTFTREEWVKSLSWAVDGCIELRGFADDPTLAPLFPHSHGLLTLHTFPKTHTLLPSTLKHSTILGVSQSSSSSTSHGGAGENNLSFRLKRKHFVLETLHLGVEGGVGERRTEPVSGRVGAVLGTGVGGGGGSGVGPTEKTEAVEMGTLVYEGVDRPKGPVEGKKPKQRARVRFGGEEHEPDRAVEVERDEPDKLDHGHHHDHAGHDDHAHAHTHTEPARGGTPKPSVRHDRMDLYEF